MYLFRIFRSFVPLANPWGFGASDWLVLGLAILLVALLFLTKLAAPYAHAIAKRPLLSMGLLFALATLSRLLLLPQSPVLIPSGADDFGYLLLADTLSHLRLANPAHPLPQFFEAVFILQQPTYASIYPLGQGIVLALGQVLFGSYWVGVLLASGAFCALCYWMLRAWVAPIWALLGGLLAAIQFGPLNPWTNSYWGGFVSAMAGCLVFGSLPRLRESPRLGNGALLGAGLGLQILTRPFEAVFLFLAAVVYLLAAFRKSLTVMWKSIAACAGVVVAAGALTLFQNKAVTHSWTTMPYMLSRYQYGVPATFTFQPNAVPHRPLTAEQKLDYQAQAIIHGPGTDSLSEYFSRLAYRFRYLRFFLLPPLYFVIVPFIPSLRQWRFAWAIGTMLLFALGTNLYAYFYPQYIAALTCLFVLISVQGLRALGDTPRKLAVSLCAASFLFWFGLYLSGADDLLPITAQQSWYYINRGDSQGRAAAAQKLAQAPGRQLVFVRYAESHRFAEWIHNDADIDSAQTIWANDLGTEENDKLIHYFPQRTVWLMEPDAQPPALSPYAATQTPVFEIVH